VSRYISAAAFLLIAGFAGCGGSTQPILIPVPDEPLESVLVDFGSGAITDPSALDVITGTAVRTDQFSGWDLIFEVAEDGTELWWPRGAITELGEDSGIQLVSRSFEDLREAPETGYVQLEPVPLAVGDVFAARSRRDPALGSIRCRRFAKIEVLAIDSEAGTVSLRHLTNPNCEKRTLVPGAEE